MIEIENLTFQFSSSRILFENLNLKISSEKPVAFVGPSGSGKTTLARLIAGHLKAQAGEIRIDSMPVHSPSRQSILVPQGDDLFPWLTVAGHLEFLSKQPGVLKQSTDLVRNFGLEEHLYQFPFQLSGGTQKRLALLRAVMLNPRVIILDETLSSVHSEQRASIVQSLAPYWKKTQLIVITHHLQELPLEYGSVFEFPLLSKAKA